MSSNRYNHLYTQSWYFLNLLHHYSKVWLQWKTKPFLCFRKLYPSSWTASLMKSWKRNPTKQRMKRKMMHSQGSSRLSNTSHGGFLNKRKPQRTSRCSDSKWFSGRILTLKCWLSENSLRNGVGGFLNFCSLEPLWGWALGEVVPARTSPTLHPPSPPTVL